MNSELIQIITEDDEVFYGTISNFTYNDTSTITTYPTSEGTPRTDNIYNNPDTYNCTINIGGQEGISDEWGSGPDRPKTAMLELMRWKNEAISLTIITPQKDYYNMFLTRINGTATQQNAYNLSASLQFDELYIASYESETLGPFLNTQVQVVDSSAAEESADSFELDTKELGKDIVTIGGGALVGFAVGGPVGALVGAGVGGIVRIGSRLGWW